MKLQRWVFFLSCLLVLASNALAWALALPGPLTGLLVGMLALGGVGLGMLAARRQRQGQMRFVQALIDALPEVVFIKDAHSRYVMVNESFNRKHGKSADQVLMQDSGTLFGANYGRAWREEDENVLAGNALDLSERRANPVTGEDEFQHRFKRRIAGPDGEALIVGFNMDTTDWNLAEIELHRVLKAERAQQEKTFAFLQRFIDAIPEPLYLKDADSRYLLVNDAFAREHLKSKAELVGLDSFALARQQGDGSQSSEEDRAALDGHLIDKEQTGNHRGTGDEYFRRVRKLRCQGLNDEWVVVGMHNDVTRWRQAERGWQSALLAETQRRVRTQEFIQRLIDVIPQPVYIKDAGGVYVRVNDAFLKERMTPAEQILGKTAHDLAPLSEVADMVADEDAEVLAGKVILKEESMPHPVTQEERFRLISKRACLDAEGNQVIVGSNFNITPWRVAERELQRALQTQTRMLQFLQGIFDAVPAPVYVENEAGELYMLNTALQALTGQRRNALLGRPSAEFGLPRVQELPADDGEGLSLDMLDATGKARNFVLRHTRTVGLEQTDMQLAVMLEVTSLRDAQANWRAAKEQADQANAAKSQFLATMSHEIRTPLSGVIGTLRLALRDTTLSPQAREYLELCQRSADGLLGIINDILDFSKIEAGEIRIERIAFDLHQLFDDALQLLRQTAQGRGLYLNVMMGEDVPQWISGDPVRIRQLLINFVGNAIKFTQQGGITVRCEAERGLDNWLRVDIQDTGIGMSAEVLPRLFQAYQQADVSTTRRFGGTGLGLSICKQLAEAMGGAVDVTSVEGQGSTFSFWVPLASAAPAAEQSATHPGARPQASALRVLCAEDGKVNQMVIRALLRDKGHEVVMVETGLDAIRALAAQPFDLILMDGRMPEMDGDQATRHIRAGGLPEAPIADTQIPIIALSANVGREDREAALTAGASAYLTKPIDEPLLWQAIDQLMAERPKLGEH